MVSGTVHSALAGSMQSGDCMVEIGPREEGSGVRLSIESVVKEAYGRQIQATVERMLGALGIGDVEVVVRDFGAMEFVIEARLETAVARARGRASP